MLTLLACAVAPGPALDATDPVPGVAMDGIPDARVASGGWTFESAEGRATLSRQGGGSVLDLGSGVLADVAFAPDGSALVFASASDSPLSDLYLVELPGGRRRQLTDWPSYEDTPVYSPDGSRLAFFSGKTGLASLFVLDLGSGEIEQVTNAGLENERHIGRAPDGYIPPPTSSVPTWTGTTIAWTSADGPVAVEIP